MKLRTGAAALFLFFLSFNSDIFAQLQNSSSIRTFRGADMSVKIQCPQDKQCEGGFILVNDNEKGCRCESYCYKKKINGQPTVAKEGLCCLEGQIIVRREIGKYCAFPVNETIVKERIIAPSYSAFDGWKQVQSCGRYAGCAQNDAYECRVDMFYMRLYKDGWRDAKEPRVRPPYGAIFICPKVYKDLNICDTLCNKDERTCNIYCYKDEAKLKLYKPEKFYVADCRKDERCRCSNAAECARLSNAWHCTDVIGKNAELVKCSR